MLRERLEACHFAECGKRCCRGLPKTIRDKVVVTWHSKRRSGNGIRRVVLLPGDRLWNLRRSGEARTCTMSKHRRRAAAY